jgi:hypothetical protein
MKHKLPELYIQPFQFNLRLEQSNQEEASLAKNENHRHQTNAISMRRQKAPYIKLG